LFVIDVATREVRPLPRLGGAHEIAPCFSSDGTQLYFLADVDGVRDVYRMPASGGPAERLTHVATGVAGITDKSPALSVGPDRLVFSVFEKRGLELRAIPVSTPGTPPPAPDRQAALLPPAVAPAIAAAAEELATGCAPAPPQPFDVGRYRGNLGLTYVGPIGFGL